MMDKKLISGIIVGILLSIAAVWMYSVDKSLWTKSGATQYLNKIGKIETVTTGRYTQKWYIKDSSTLCQKEWEAMDMVDIEFIEIDNNVIIITDGKH